MDVGGEAAQQAISILLGKRSTERQQLPAIFHVFQAVPDPQHLTGVLEFAARCGAIIEICRGYAERRGDASERTGCVSSLVLVPSSEGIGQNTLLWCFEMRQNDSR
ncbi:hypothetical protein MKL09_13685 [Methylobacterium sp. J-048]|uniref:hypothetical protein n=1 Tax=Methylobacterium sp. J-048 TaxID=2836635 RepID=UPI001FB88EEA|nr:hypothetical protein [Methylobacterium sp. J-048]MCJ2057607.1 hypothetical protein [Methylobacterium sp. J-048]